MNSHIVDVPWMINPAARARKLQVAPLKANARTHGIDYLICQGKIWSLARTNEGWRRYNGGMFDPRSVTAGHYDHLHVSTTHQ